MNFGLMSLRKEGGLLNLERKDMYVCMYVCKNKKYQEDRVNKKQMKNKWKFYSYCYCCLLPTHFYRT